MGRWYWEAIIAAIIAMAGLAMALGLKTPSDRLTSIETDVKEVKNHVASHDVEFGEINTKLRDIADDVKDLLKRKHD